MIVLMLVRIDMILLGIEKLGEKFKSSTSQQTTAETLPQPEIQIPINEDRSLARTPRSEFFALLDDFHLNPKREVREQIIEVLRKNPTILGTKLDPIFEGEIFKMADLIYNKSPELPLMLLDFLGLLQGENLEMVKRFFTLLMDNDIEIFLKFYSRTKEITCPIGVLLGHKVPEEEVLNEFIEREQSLKAFLAGEKIDPALSVLGNNCLTVVQMQINKLSNIPTPPPAPASVEAPPSEPAPAPAPVQSSTP